MKKIFAFTLFVIVSSFTSCSSDDENDNNIIVHNASGTLTLKINGELRSFSTFKVIEKRYNGYTDLVIEGTQIDDITKNFKI